MDIVVVGAGSLGSLVGGLLAREHDVTLVGREPHVSQVTSVAFRSSEPRSFGSTRTHRRRCRNVPTSRW